MSKEYTAYPGENEVLVQDGLEYLIKNKNDITMDGKLIYNLEF